LWKSSAEKTKRYPGYLLIFYSGYRLRLFQFIGTGKKSAGNNPIKPECMAAFDKLTIAGFDRFANVNSKLALVGPHESARGSSCFELSIT